jgi:nucleotide-binding universal stress UspA family protein
VSHILIALDKPGAAPHALQWASLLSARYEANVTLMHVVTSGVAGGALAAAAVVAGAVPVDLRAQRALAEDRGQWLQLAVDAGIPSERASSEVASGVPAIEILRATERLQADLVVMGRHGTGTVRRAVLGSVVDGVLRGATCPVLVVPE